MGMNERIDRGVDLLNAHTPHWFKLIDLGRLNLSICSDCIIGQVFGTDEFAATVEGLVPEAYPSDYGFDTDEDYEGGYAELTNAWVSRIEELVDIADSARWTPEL